MIETLALIGIAFALAAGLFGLAGIAFFWITAFAAAFLFALAIWAIEVLTAKLADALRFVSAFRRASWRINALAEIGS